MKNVSIKHLQLFEDRSDAACRVVVKTTGSWGGMRGGHGTRMRIWGKGVCSDVACRVALLKSRVAIRLLLALHGVWDYLKLGDAHAFGLAL